MSNLEYVTPEGFRLDGRRMHEPRCVRCSVGSDGGCEAADGCAVFELGNTKALAYVYGPMEARQRGQTHSDRAAITCTLMSAAFATTVRPRRMGRGPDRQTLERAVWIQQTLESAVLLDQYPRSQIRVFVQVIQAEGGFMVAAINAATLALADAGIPMRGLVVACSSGMLGRRPVIDLNREEERAGGAQVLLASFAGTKQILLMEVESKVPEGSFPKLHELSLTGCDVIAEQMRACLLEHAVQGFSARLSHRKGRKS